MKKSEFLLLLLYVIYVVVISESDALNFYIPKLVGGGFIIVACILISCLLREKAEKLTDKDKKKGYNNLAFAGQIVSWSWALFYIAMVVFGF